MRCSIILAVSIFIMFPAFAFSATLKVPSQYPKIQDAIDAASGGDTVLVDDGTYVENIDFIGKTITVTSVNGPSGTIIDGGNPANPDFGSVVTFQSLEGLDSVLDGFTITNGTGNWYSTTWPANFGGGIFIKNASPTVMNNIITNNEVTSASGGGICCGENASSMIISNIISGNNTSASGGGIVFFQCNPDATIKNNQIYGNWAKSNGGGVSFIHCSNQMIDGNSIYENQADGDYPPYQYWGGGGIHCFQASPVIVNNYVAHNSCPMLAKGGGILCYDYSSPIIRNNFIGGNSANIGGGFDCYQNCNPVIENCTFWGNSAQTGGALACRNVSIMKIIDSIFWYNEAATGKEIYIGPPPGLWSTLTISYSDLNGGQASVENNGGTLNWGPGMIDLDPLYAAGPSGFHYLGQTAAGQPTDSPCVDTGSNLASNLGMDVYWTRTDGVADSGIVDMGFHYGDFLFPALQTDTFSIEASTGGDADFLLIAGLGNANRNYIMLGSVTGTDPGIPLPGGQATLPLNWDDFTSLIIDLINTPIFSNFMGQLDGTGMASAKFDTLGSFSAPPGITLYFAYALNNPWDFVSNLVVIEIVP